jgi:hypothetical protein
MKYWVQIYKDNHAIMKEEEEHLESKILVGNQRESLARP